LICDQSEDDQQVEQIYCNKCPFPMFHQFPPEGEAEHTDKKEYGNTNQYDGYQPVADYRGDRKHQDYAAGGRDPDETEVPDLARIEQAGDHRQARTVQL
jgi:hypothetical protein